MLSELYKSQGIHSNEYRQSERRHALLERQRQHRNELVDVHRSIEPLKKIIRKASHSKYPSIKNQLTLSEWLKEVPDDIEKWYIKPCPKGTRVLVIAVDGTTRVFNKYGAFMKRFRTEFPGDYRNRRDQLTILDCIYVANLDEYFVLDALAYGNQALTDCEAEFRFFWIESQIRESHLDRTSEHHEHPFRLIDKCNCGDDTEFNEFLSNYPIWPNNQPELDGFLFYHKESSYVKGNTPLVGWLFAFMIPELFDVPYLNENYLIDKPTDYINHLTFMEEFDKKMNEKRKDRRKKLEHMDDNDAEEETAETEIHVNITPDCNDPTLIAKQTMELETDGADFHTDFDAANELNMSH